LAENAFQSYRRAERWDEAAEFAKMSVDAQPDDPLRWLTAAPFIVLAEGEAAFRKHSRRMLDRFADTTDGREARLTCKTCLLVPGIFGPDDVPTETFVKSLDDSDRSLSPAWGWGIRAMLAYRGGDAKSAVEYVKKSDQYRPIDFVRAANLPVLAMAQQQLGDEAAAKAALQQASQVLERLRADEANVGHHDLLIAELLFGEAEKQVKGATPAK
jgi:hypothetical protein